MNIAEMHVWFRQYAQQMGMQNVRAILPEQIDLLINTSITDTVNQLIRENIGITNDRVITDNSKIGQINALRSLYTVKEIEVFKSNYVTKTNLSAEVINKYNIMNITSAMYTSTDKTLPAGAADGAGTLNVGSYFYFSDTEGKDYVYKCIKNGCCGYNPNVGGVPEANKLVNIINTNFDEYFKPLSTGNTFVLDTAESKIGKIKGINVIDNYMFLVDFSLNYGTASKGISTDEDPVFDNSYKSNYFPVRLIDDAYLADALNDFVLKNRLRSPILTIYNDIDKKFYFDLYIDEFTKHDDDTYYLVNNLVPYKFRVSYIAKPDKVQYADDIAGISVDCNLPESMHIDILKHAVDLYRIAITGSLSSAQQQAQTQQQEDARNNYRNDNGQRQQ